MEEQTPESAPGKKGKLKKIIVLLLAVVLIGGAAGGGFYYWRGLKTSAAENNEDSAKSKKNKSKKAAEKTEEDESEEKSAKDEEKSDKEKESKKDSGSPESVYLKESTPDDEDVKQIVELQPFIVNLADTDEPRYLRMTVSLGVGGEEESKEKPNEVFNTRVRNAILAVLSVKKSEDILSLEGKSKLRKEILKAARAVSSEPEVEAIYITEFIVQL